MSQYYPTRTKTIASFAMLAFAMVLSQAATAWAGSQKFDQQMQAILEQYLKIPKALAADKTEGVVEAAKKMESLANKLDAASVSGEHAMHYSKIPASLKTAARQLKNTKTIKAMRASLKELSKPMAMWVTMSKPKGVSVAYCSMAPGSWLQQGTTIANPYYGAKMLRCGEIVAGEGTAKTQQHK